MRPTMEEHLRLLDLRVLSLWQPWASACVLPDSGCGGRPAKQFETRHWEPRLRTPFGVVIHATQRLEKTPLENSWIWAEWLNRMGLHVTDLPRGAIIGVATVASVEPTGEGFPERVERAMGDWSAGRFAWELRDVRALAKPIPLKGRQTPLWQLTGEPLRLVAEQVMAERSE